MGKKSNVQSADSADKILKSLPEPFRSTLLSMYELRPQLGTDGKRHALDGVTLLSPKQGMWLNRLCRDLAPTRSLEIGLAYGYSTAYFLAAIQENGIGHHSAVDPFQIEKWRGIGACLPGRLGMSHKFRFVEEKSAAALQRFADAGETFDLIFIDGNHRFDNALVDFTLSAELCRTGGIIVLDDLWMPSIRSVVAFITSNRKDFRTLAAPTSNMAAFERISDDTRAWNHYIDFSMSRPARNGLHNRITQMFAWPRHALQR